MSPQSSHSRQPAGILGRSVFYVVKLWVLVSLKLYFRVRVENRPKLAGGFVMVANHTSLLDPVIVGAVASGWTGTHRVIFMMSSMMARSRALGWFYRWNKIIPVEPQGGNKAALRAAHEVLDGGDVLGIFPEGGLSRDGQLMLGSPGAVSLGLAKNAPIVPVGIVGASRAFPPGAGFPKPAKIVVRFGTPIPVEELMAGGDRKQRLARATARIMKEIAALSGQTAREEQLRPRQT